MSGRHLCCSADQTHVPCVHAVNCENDLHGCYSSRSGEILWGRYASCTSCCRNTTACTYSWKRRIVIDPKKYGGLGKPEPGNANELRKFLLDTEVLQEGDRVDWKEGKVYNKDGKVISRIGKSINKALRKSIGKDKEIFTQMAKVQKEFNNNDSPTYQAIAPGVARNNFEGLIGMGHLFIKDFPTNKLWKQVTTLGFPSPSNWKYIKEVADKFAKASNEERRELMDRFEKEYNETEKEYKKAEEKLDKNQFEDYRSQYWTARGTFQSYFSPKVLDHFKKWKDLTDKFYKSKDAAPVHKIHELAKQIPLERQKELKNLSNIEQEQQEYALWKSIHGKDLSVVLSRDPVDVLRMSDHPKAVQKIDSCHSEGSSEFDCAIEEAEEGGLVAYVVNKDDIEGKDLEKGELFEDEDRDIKGIKPYSRLRLRRFEKGEGDSGLEVAVPETSVYGADFDDFVQMVTNWARKAQPEFEVGDDQYTHNAGDWKLTGGTHQDTPSSELFDNFFGRNGDEEEDEPTEDQYDPYGEGYTPEDSPYYDPNEDDEPEDQGEAQVSKKTVHPWRENDEQQDFWTWMSKNYPKVQNPNTRGTQKEISPSTLRGYSRGGTNYAGRARDTVRRYLTRYQKEQQKGQEKPQASRVASEWFLELVQDQEHR